MSAGKPDYAKLYKMGKLPKEARGNIPLLKQLDDAEKEIEELKKEIAGLKGEELEDKNEEVMIQCEVKDCEFVAKGSEGQAKHRLTLHSKTHKA